jgi:hypothetical protein
MSGTDEQRAIMDAEFYWFGGLLSAPKVYDNGTNFHAPPTIRVVADAVGVSRVGLESERHIRAFVDEAGDWTVTIDPV